MALLRLLWRRLRRGRGCAEFDLRITSYELRGMDNGEPWNELLACSRLFMEVQSMEPLLRGGLAMSITRSGDRVISCKVYAWGSTTALHRHKVRARDVRSGVELQAELDALWRALVEKKLIKPDNFCES